MEPEPRKLNTSLTLSMVLPSRVILRRTMNIESAFSPSSASPPSCSSSVLAITKLYWPCPEVMKIFSPLRTHFPSLSTPRVRIAEKSAKSGRIEIEYYSMEDLDRIYGLLVGDKA